MTEREYEYKYTDLTSRISTLQRQQVYLLAKNQFIQNRQVEKEIERLTNMRDALTKLYVSERSTVEEVEDD